MAERTVSILQVAAHVRTPVIPFATNRSRVTFSSGGNPVAKGGVDVHIPEARNQVFPSCSDTFAARGIRRSRSAGGDDAPAGDNDCHVRLRRTAATSITLT